MARIGARVTLAAAAALAMLFVVSADLPVHCLHAEALGEWEFKLSKNTHDHTLHCGHEMPDSVMTMVNKGISYDTPKFEVTSTMRVTLGDPNKATSNGKAGTWTMVYDEGFEVDVGGQEFFTFFRYTPKSEDASPDEINDFNSICTETYVGWFHNTDKTHWGCFIARKVNGGASAGQGSALQQRFVSRRSVSRLPPVGQANGAQEDGGVFVQDTAFVEEVNADPASTWTAREHPQFTGLPLEHVARMLGRVNFNKRAAPRRSESAGDWAAAAEMAAAEERRLRGAAPAVASQLPRFMELPTTLDWRSENGGKYATPVISQGSCGSCYAIASADAASWRLRIATKAQDTTTLSPRNAMACDAYNQGCDGGYPFLVGKHGNDMGFVPTDCAEYSADSSMTCDRTCEKQGRVYYVHNTRYIGGWYGACSENAMLQELQSGPVVVALNAPPDLFYYSGGVYKFKDTNAENRRINGMSRWEKTNHAVVAVGYGEEGGQKYWIIKNSWGESWGENGYFRLARGDDTIAAESMAVAFDVDLQKLPASSPAHGGATTTASSTTTTASTTTATSAASTASVMNVGGSTHAHHAHHAHHTHHKQHSTESAQTDTVAKFRRVASHVDQSYDDEEY